MPFKVILIVEEIDNEGNEIDTHLQEVIVVFDSGRYERDMENAHYFAGEILEKYQH